jgi:periplasmic divalent cation tolerance protein
VIVIYVPCKNEEEAIKIAKIIIEKKLAICTNIFPHIHSVFRWQGKLEENKESLLIVKTPEKYYKTALDKIIQLHSYDLPEILTWSVKTHSKGIEDWIKQEIG